MVLGVLGAPGIDLSFFPFKALGVPGPSRSFVPTGLSGGSVWRQKAGGTEVLEGAVEAVEGVFLVSKTNFSCLLLFSVGVSCFFKIFLVNFGWCFLVTVDRFCWSSRRFSFFFV